MPTNTPDNRYGSIAAEIYDLDKPYGKLVDTAFYIGALKDISGPILEPACGSARALVPLAQAGHEMWGFDTSPEMLAQAKARCEAAGVTAHLSRQAYEDFTYDIRFAALILPVASFTLIGDAATARRVLKRFHGALTPGGRVLIDMTTLAALANMADDRRSWTADNGDLLTLEGIRTATDWMAQTSRLSLRYERWRNNRLIASELEPFVQRHWGIEEFRMALAEAGFTAITPHADYTPGKPPTASTRMITWQATA